MSRPMSSVPNQAIERGDRNWFAPSEIGITGWLTPYLANTGAKMHTKRSTLKMTDEIIAAL